MAIEYLHRAADDVRACEEAGDPVALQRAKRVRGYYMTIGRRHGLDTWDIAAATGIAIEDVLAVEHETGI